MLSIYLLLDGSRVMRWLRENLPLPQQKRGLFFLNTLETVVGGYILPQLGFIPASAAGDFVAATLGAVILLVGIGLVRRLT